MIDDGSKDASALAEWRAKEALRMGEVRLTAQASALQALEARAMAVIGWGSLIVAAGVGAFLSDLADHLRWGGVTLAGVAMAAVLVASRILQPRAGWGVAGHNPMDVLGVDKASVAEAAAWLAEGYAAVIDDNRARLVMDGRRLSLAIRLLIGGLFGAAAVVASFGLR